MACEEAPSVTPECWAWILACSFIRPSSTFYATVQVQTPKATTHFGSVIWS